MGEKKMRGDFEGHAEEIERAKKRRHVDSSEHLWGASAEAQEKGAPIKGASAAPRRSFDPEQDLVVRKPITGADFSKLVENSSAGLAGRFSRSAVATSFL